MALKKRFAIFLDAKGDPQNLSWDLRKRRKVGAVTIILIFIVILFIYTRP